MLKTQTSGTWIVIAANCAIAVLGILQGENWINLVGSEGAGWMAAVLAFANTAAHYFTGATPPQAH